MEGFPQFSRKIENDFCMSQCIILEIRANILSNIFLHNFNITRIKLKFRIVIIYMYIYDN